MFSKNDNVITISHAEKYRKKLNQAHISWALESNATLLARSAKYDTLGFYE